MRGKEGGLGGGAEAFEGLFCSAAALGQGDDFHVTALELVHETVSLRVAATWLLSAPTFSSCRSQ